MKRIGLLTLSVVLVLTTIAGICIMILSPALTFNGPVVIGNSNIIEISMAIIGGSFLLLFCLGIIANNH